MSTLQCLHTGLLVDTHDMGPLFMKFWGQLVEIADGLDLFGEGFRVFGLGVEPMAYLVRP